MDLRTRGGGRVSWDEENTMALIGNINPMVFSMGPGKKKWVFGVFLEKGREVLRSSLG